MPAEGSTSNPYENLKRPLTIDDKTYHYFQLADLDAEKYARLPYSIRVLLESAIRNCDDFHVTRQDVQNILAWESIQSEGRDVEVAFKPARVILQDFTGVPAVVDFAAMRDAVDELKGDPERINPICPADLVIDHSVQVDVFRRNPASGMTPWDTGPGHAPARPPPVLPDLEDTASRAAAISRLPVFQQLPTTSTPVAPPIRVPRGRGRMLKGRRPVVQRDYPSCKGQCDGVTCILEADDVRALPCLQPTEDKCTEKPLGGVRNVDYGTGPITEATCPFHKHKSAWADALNRNQELEFERNKERFLFLKWGAQALRNMLIVPPGMGIVHQVNLEYLARVVFSDDSADSVLYPDSVVGTDSHTTMINGLGVLGWGVGGIEAEAVMLGQAISMVLPPVVGYKITGTLNALSTSTDVVLTITKHLRQVGVVGKFVEFFGPGVAALSIADRATISNMCPEYGATVGFFPVDAKSLEYLVQTNRSPEKVAYIEAYLKAASMFRHYDNPEEDPVFSQVVELDLGTVVPSLSGPKRPHDRVAVSDMQNDFRTCLTNKVGFKGFGIPQEKLSTQVSFKYEGQEYTLSHGSVVIAAITSCTNTSNPSVMLGAGLLAKKAVEAGLSVKPYVKTSLSPGSGVVTYYLEASGVVPALEKLGFGIVGYGCMTCIGNSGPLPESVVEAIEQGELVCCGVLSGNRNFEGRIHPNTRANYLASPLLVVAYAIAGTVDIDFETQPLGYNDKGEAVFLRDIYPSREEIQAVERAHVVPAMFQHVYSQLAKGSAPWNALQVPNSQRYPWDSASTYIQRPPFFEGMTATPPGIRSVEKARVLLYLGDSVTTDHISPAGSIARNSPAARYLTERGLTPRDFNSYGSRRGNDAVMVRGTFANIRLINRLMSKPGPRTVHFPTGQELDIFDAAVLYRNENTPLVVIAGKEYGSGSSRDWAAKGPYLLGIRAVIAESFERIHRSNLVGMGIVPLQFLPGQDADKVGIKGTETFDIIIPEDVTPGQTLRVQLDDGRSFEVLLRFDTDVELTYFKHGGILNYMVRKMSA